MVNNLGGTSVQKSPLVYNLEGTSPLQPPHWISLCPQTTGVWTLVQWLAPLVFFKTDYAI